MRLFARLLGTLSDRWWFALPAFALLLLIPPLLHGQPFLYWDTAQYYHYGAQLVDFATAKIGRTIRLDVLGRSEIAKQQGSGNLDDGPGDRARTTPNAFDKALIDRKSQAGGMASYGGRSPFYSMWLYSVAWALSLWGVLITQAVATAWIIWRAATHAAGVHRFEAGVAIVALGALGAGAGFVTGFVMPDIYAAVAIICVALLFAYADQMSPLERVGLAAILAVSAVFHKTHLAIAAALILAGIGVTHFLRSEKRPLRSRALLATASALGVAVALQLAFDTAARAVLGTNPKPPPFLTMRLLVDGPGRLYLDSVCPGTATFLVCAYRNQSFKSSDEFYVGAFQALPVEQRLKLIEEEPRFVTAVAMHYPLSVLKTAVANAVEQFVLIWPAEAWIDPGVSFSAPAWSGADRSVLEFMCREPWQVRPSASRSIDRFKRHNNGRSFLRCDRCPFCRGEAPRHGRWRLRRLVSAQARDYLRLPYSCGPHRQCGNLRRNCRATHAIPNAGRVARSSCSRSA